MKPSLNGTIAAALAGLLVIATSGLAATPASEDPGEAQAHLDAAFADAVTEATEAQLSEGHESCTVEEVLYWLLFGGCLECDGQYIC